jgi:hypothetical protein
VGATGTATVNFGGFPGASDTSVLVTGQSGILAGSLVEAWLIPVATSDHSADEHLVDGPRILAGNISPGVGFTIYGIAWPDGYSVPDAIYRPGAVPYGYPEHGRTTPMPYGQWSVAWVWN